MTVKQPCTGIIEHKTNHQIPSRGKHSNITARRVLEVEVILIGEVAVGFLTEDVEVVSMKMDRVRDRCCVDDDPEGPLRPMLVMRQG